MNKIDEALTRSVENIYPSKSELEKVMDSGKKLRIYYGIDPTGKLHIGHLVALKKLKQFQDLGHEIIILIGDFTAQIGDPTDKTAVRRKLTREEVENNSKNYKQLIGKILDIEHSKLRFLRNEKWTNQLKPVDLLELAANFTVQQLIERDMFQERLKNGKEIYLHEFLYPIFQAYDSVTMDVDMEIGGNDQTFNMLAGRNLMKKVSGKNKFVLSTKLLTDPSGKKMGKSEGNIIALDDPAETVYGKVMAFPDELILTGFELLTDKNLNEVEKKNNPRDLKAQLAREIVAELHGDDAAEVAEKNFDNVFRDKKMPEVLKVYNLLGEPIGLRQLLVKVEFAKSNADARRKIEQGGVKINSQKITDINYVFESKGEFDLQVGKLNFIKIKND